MSKQNIVLNYYQKQSDAQMVIAELKKRHFTQFAMVYRKHDLTFDINRYCPMYLYLSVCSGITAIFCLITIKSYFNDSLSWSEMAIAIAGIFVAIGILISWCLSRTVSLKMIDRFKDRVTIGGMLIMVRTTRSAIPEVKSILQHANKKIDNDVTVLFDDL